MHEENDFVYYPQEDGGYFQGEELEYAARLLLERHGVTVSKEAMARASLKEYSSMEEREIALLVEELKGRQE